MNLPSFAFDGAFADAFATPESVGTWLIWGNSSNGKTTFALQLAKYLCRFDRVIYDSLEEGASLNMRNTLVRVGMEEVNRKFIFLDGEPIEELSKRLEARKSPGIAIIDSFQYTQMSYKQYLAFKERHKNKLLIFISHADGKFPSGRSAKSVMYDASLKIYVEGYRALSKGRFIGRYGAIDVWKERADHHWGFTVDNHPKKI